MKNSILIKRSNGFTLIEAMMVIAVIATIAAIAIPSYTNYVRRAERGAAQARMLEIAGLLENNFLQRGQYVGAFIAAVNADPALNVTPNPASVRYTITIAPPNNSQIYTITATPVGNQVGDRCGVMTLNNTNQKTATLEDVVINDCW